MLCFYIQQRVYVNPKLLIDLSSCLSPLVTVKFVFKVCFCLVDKYICVFFFFNIPHRNGIVWYFPFSVV